MKKKTIQTILLSTILLVFIIQIIIDVSGIKQKELEVLGTQITNMMLICTYAICKHLDKDTL